MISAKIRARLGTLNLNNSFRMTCALQMLVFTSLMISRGEDCMDEVASAFRALLEPAITPDSRLTVASNERHLLDVCIDCIKVITPDGILLHMNKAGCDALGVSPDSGFGMPWVPLLQPAIHDEAYAAVNRARGGETARFEGRSGSGPTLMHWDNLLTPIFNDDNSVKAVLCVSRDVTQETLAREQMRSAIERETLLTQEMRHRIKNLYSQVSGLISMTEREVEAGADVRAFAEDVRGRLTALARASDATFTASVLSAGEDYSGDLREIITAVLQPYGRRLTIEGPDTPVCARNITSLALVFHELATNAVKYGAFSVPEGGVAVTWELRPEALVIDWQETGATGKTVPQRTGFGTSVIERALRGIGASIEFTWCLEGLHAQIRLPRE